MENAARRSPLKGPRYLLPMVTNEFPEFAPYYDLCVQFLRLTTYDHDFCLKLLALARKADVSWSVRRFAVLMLEHQILKMDHQHLVQFNSLLSSLNLKEATGRITKAVLREGYTTTDPRQFLAELQRKLARLDRVHNKIQGTKTSEAAWREFFKSSRDDCKLSLARYLFTPEEVVDEIFERLLVTEGLRDVDPHEPRYVGEELKRAIKLLPHYEARILQLLCRTADVYWVSDATTAEINSLVEYPLTTVVLVIKPPGSSFEFEIKRAGLRGQNSLNVVFSRRGYVVAPSHRLSGGSMQWLLRYETRNASKLNRVYRLVHETEAPMPAYISRSTITSIPVPNDEVQTLTYFTDPDSFGPQFPRMRAAMQEIILQMTVYCGYPYVMQAMASFERVAGEQEQ